MRQANERRRPTKHLLEKRARFSLVVALAALAPNALAFEIETANPDVKVHWDNTVQYTAAGRLQGQSDVLINSPPTTINQDDADRSFNRGLISNRLDLYSEFDITYRNFGARVSGAAWYDSIYNTTNDNNSPSTFNASTVSNNQFTKATRDLLGRHAEFLDYFVFGKGDLGDMKGTFRAGNHTLLWGESLFFGANGIAGGQQPIDVVKLLSVPNTPFRELIRPVGQVSGQLQVTPELSFGGYYQYDWKKTRLPAVGSYFSTVDILDVGGERLLLGLPLVPGGGPAAFWRGTDELAKNSGQFGLQMKFRYQSVDFGLYALRYHDKTPQIYLQPSVVQPPGAPPVVLDPPKFNPVTGQIGSYWLVYPENIRTFGASFSTTIEELNVAGEVSVRRNTPLVSDAQVALPGTSYNNSDNPLYAVGNSVHAQVSWIWSISPNWISSESSLVGEIAWNRRTSIIRNPDALDANVTRDAWVLRTVYEPKYRQVLPGLDVSVPIGVGFNPIGLSSVVATLNGGVEHGGDFTAGVSGAYLDQWRFGFNYTHYFGHVGTFLDAGLKLSGKQALGSRDFLSFIARTTF